MILVAVLTWINPLHSFSKVSCDRLRSKCLLIEKTNICENCLSWLSKLVSYANAFSLLSKEWWYLSWLGFAYKAKKGLAFFAKCSKSKVLRKSMDEILESYLFYAKLLKILFKNKSQQILGMWKWHVKTKNIIFRQQIYLASWIELEEA